MANDVANKEEKRSFLYLLYWLSKKYPITQRFKVVTDYLIQYIRKGLRIEEYYNIDMFAQSPQFRSSFLGWNEARYYLDVLNPVKYYILARNKYITHKMLEDAGIPMAELYCCYQPDGSILDNSDCASDIYNVCRILQEKNVEACVIKSAESKHGESVWLVKHIAYTDKDAELTLFNGNQVMLSSIAVDCQLVFESVVRQTEQLSSFNNSSVNTIRFMTTLFPTGEAKIIATFVKIGREGKCVDNAGGGGNVDVCVDVESGELKYAVQFDGWRNIKDISSHPDSGAQLNGVVISNWDAIKSEVVKFQQAFPYCKAAGWDIALTDDGPVVIEVNDFWDVTGQLFIRRGWRKEIRDCYLAWGQTGKQYDLQRQPNELSDGHLKRIVAK